MGRRLSRSLGWWVTLLVATPLSAGTISLAWTPAAGASGYRVYYGAGSGNYTLSKDVGASTETTISGLNDCTTWYLAVKAYNAAGESPVFSNEVTGWARPRVDASTPNARQQGQRITLEITGSNFQPGATVEIDNPNVHFASADVMDCGTIQLEATVAPSTSGVRAAEVGTFAVSVTNPDDTFGTLTDGFEVLINPARFDVNETDSATRDRVDGKDTVWLARLFGAPETAVLYDPDFDLDGDGWVDGQDLSYVASNLGKCWSGTAWTVASCPSSQP